MWTWFVNHIWLDLAIYWAVMIPLVYGLRRTVLPLNEDTGLTIVITLLWPAFLALGVPLLILIGPIVFAFELAKEQHALAENRKRRN